MNDLILDGLFYVGLTLLALSIYVEAECLNGHFLEFRFISYADHCASMKINEVSIRGSFKRKREGSFLDLFTSQLLPAIINFPVVAGCGSNKEMVPQTVFVSPLGSPHSRKFTHNLPMKLALGHANCHNLSFTPVVLWFSPVQYIGNEV